MVGALGAVNLAVLAVGLDGTVLSVALPTLARSLHASESDLQWFSSAYLLVLAAAMLPAGLLGDRYGRKRVMLAAPRALRRRLGGLRAPRHPARFIAARVLLGLAGAGVIVMALSALTVLFDDEERPKAVGHLGGRELPGASDRADPGRLAAHPLLVGLGVPDERPRGRSSG